MSACSWRAFFFITSEALAFPYSNEELFICSLMALLMCRLCCFSFYGTNGCCFFLAEQIVMTPKCKTANSTTLIVERKRQQAVAAVNGSGEEKDVHVAGGDHKGIVINKQMTGMYMLYRALSLKNVLEDLALSCVFGFQPITTLPNQPICPCSSECSW